MTQPVAYTRIFDFTGYQASSPSTPLPGNQVDAELNALKTTTDQIRANLAIIQRDDTLLGNNTVHPDAFTVASQALIAGSAGWNPKGAWLTATSYSVKDFVTQSSTNYVCVTAHTSGTFATDLAAGKWQATLNISAGAAILKDGSVSPTANIPWANFKITGLGDGTLAQDAVTIKQAQSNTLEWGGISTGAAGNFVVTLSPAPSAYVTGMVVRFQTHQANNATDPVLNINGLGNKTIKKMGTSGLAANDMSNGAIVEAEYDGTNFQILSLIGNTAVLGTNTFNAQQIISIATAPALQIVSTLAGAGLGPTVELQRNISGSNGNLLGNIDRTGQSSTGVARTYARTVGKITSASNTSENGELQVHTIQAGAVAARVNIGNGLYTPNAAGGDQGADTINASAIYVGGVALSAGGEVSGAIKAYAGRTAPAGYLICDGLAVSRATYASLFAIMCPTIGTFTVTIAAPAVVTLAAHGMQTGEKFRATTSGALPTNFSANTDYFIIRIDANSFNICTSLANANAAIKITTTGTQSGTHTAQYFGYGAGDGSTTFNVPDMRGNVPIGGDAMGQGAASRLTFATSGYAGTAIGSLPGEQAHALSIAELAAHTHNVTGASNVSGTTHATMEGSSLSVSDATSSTGSGTAHNNVQPGQITNYIIKT